MARDLARLRLLVDCRRPSMTRPEMQIHNDRSMASPKAYTCTIKILARAVIYWARAAHHFDTLTMPLRLKPTCPTPGLMWHAHVWGVQKD
mmetsp:Transcript_34060/g.56398  ORF Transcript_34060/g.56398 Transcript_34060/m.56398 type:complete len:90 (-) Transcript_34060:138-407(-)